MDNTEMSYIVLFNFQPILFSPEKRDKTEVEICKDNRLQSRIAYYIVCITDLIWSCLHVFKSSQLNQ